MTDPTRRRFATLEDMDDVPVPRSTAPDFQQVLARSVSRRGVLLGGTRAAALGAGVLAAPSLLVGADARAAGADRFDFEEIAHGIDGTHHVAPGYEADVLLRWGDPLFTDSPAFDPVNQTADAQERQFGYNNDFIGCIALERDGDEVTRAVLCINHEYTNGELMFAGLGDQSRAEPRFADMTLALVDTEMAAHGGSVVEIVKRDGQWQVDPAGARNRRISGRSTVCTISGPAAGSPRLATSADPDGNRIIGTLNNCAGGMTPWGTWLTAEENFNGYFSGDIADSGAEQANHERYGVPGKWYAWGLFHDRFDISREPNEPNRFGWIVEIDPHDPASVPVKRSALGRLKHEGAQCLVNSDGRVVIYTGDDQRFEYLYKFVSDGKVDADHAAANRDLLDHGVLSVAVFHEDGTVTWKPLVHGEGPLTADNGFAGQADVLIETRRAADLLGATPLDRPEDVEGDDKGNVYVLLTNNSKRTAEQVDAVNSRSNNLWGQVVQLVVAGNDHSATRCEWRALVQCGNPADPAANALWNPATSENGWFACPDNCAVDHRGRLWISTDQGSGWSRASGTADGIWALETEGEGRGTGKMFYRVPAGAEMCGPCFSEDDATLFVAVQHVAADGMKDYPGFERESTFDDPATRWPDFDPALPPRPSVVAITRKGGGRIG